VLVVFAIVATAMLATIGLLYSFGLVLSQRRALQTAVDAASLAGGWQVLSELQSDNRSNQAVLDRIVSYAVANGVPSDGTEADGTYIAASYTDASGAAIAGATVGTSGSFPTNARGVQVTISAQVPTVLPGFVRVNQLLVQTSATASVRPTGPPNALAVIPIAVLQSDAQAALAGHATYDLFAAAHSLSGGQAPSLNLGAAGAPSTGTLATDMQFWSDGQHEGNWQLAVGTNVSLTDAGYFPNIATGLHDNVRRQALPADASGARYALVSVPVYDTATSSSVHVVGFAELKLRDGDISASSARGVFVPYATGAGPSTGASPSTDLGAALVQLAS
jgi:Flp pilus assembly protein TadG